MTGSPKAARAVGMCMKTNPHIPTIPCHRVVAGDGKLTGYSAGEGLKTKREMLEAEGVVFVGDRVNLAGTKILHTLIIPLCFQIAKKYNT